MTGTLQLIMMECCHAETMPTKRCGYYGDESDEFFGDEVGTRRLLNRLGGNGFIPSTSCVVTCIKEIGLTNWALPILSDYFRTEKLKTELSGKN